MILFQSQYDLNFCNDKSLTEVKAHFLGVNKNKLNKKNDMLKDYEYIYT